MKKMILTATMVACGLALLVSCQKENVYTVSKGKMLLTMEAFGGEKTTKTSVSGNTVQWIGTETVSVNGNDYAVTVSGSEAYIDGAGIADGALYGYYACGTVENPQTSAPTVTIPSSYSSSYSGDRQVIDLPMAAYSSTKGDALEFKHLTAAVKVTVKNGIGENGLVIDNVTVSSSTSKLNGPLSLDLTDEDNFGVSRQSGSGSVAVNLIGVALNSNATCEVQVPILPIASGEELTVRISAHKGSVAYIYQHAANIEDALPRNYMLTANCLILTGGKVTNGSTVNLTSLTNNYVARYGDVLTGTLDNNVMISIADGATVTLNNVSINGENDDIYAWAGITCEGDATIILKDGTTNTVKGFYEDYPGIYVPEGSTLTIQGTGSLNVSSNGYGAGIGGGYGISCGNIVINGGSIEAEGGESAAGIGGGGYRDCGYITISGSTVTAAGGESAAGIGCGFRGDCGDITISGSTVTATGGDYGAGIGSGQSSISGGIAISSCGNITISGDTVTAEGGDQAAGIGGGSRGVCGNITISDGTVTATGGDSAAGIGGGWGDIDDSDSDIDCGVITISGGTVTATGGYNAAGIGSGCEKNNCSGITISGGTVDNATGGDYAAGIGSGGGSYCDYISISGGTVNATGGKYAAGIGSGGSGGDDVSHCGNITISNTVTSVTATKGAEATNSIGKGKGSNSTCGTVTIGGNPGAISTSPFIYPAP